MIYYFLVLNLFLNRYVDKKRINSFFKIDKIKVKIKIGQYRWSSHNNEIKCL